MKGDKKKDVEEIESHILKRYDLLNKQGNYLKPLICTCIISRYL